MRILLVAMSESVHTARWIAQIADQGWDLHLFPSIDKGESHRELKGITVHHSFYGGGQNSGAVRVRGIPLCDGDLAALARFGVNKLFPACRARQLARLIRRLKPDLVHILEIQHAGYLLLDAAKCLTAPLPPTIVTSWGSDLYLFGRMSEHRPRIDEVLGKCDFFSADCRRDYRLAEEHGFTGRALPSVPGGGGFDLARCAALRSPGSVSQRRVIMVKGYQGWSGRALVALRALSRCADLLGGYRIVIYSVFSSDVPVAAELLRQDAGLDVEIVPNGTEHETLLALHGAARISLALGISDGTPNSMLEAMVMGSFVIQSRTSAADEWITDGVTGLLVPPEDPEAVEQAIRRALLDDGLVDRAAEENGRLAAERLERTGVKQRAVDFYRSASSRAVPESTHA